MLYELTILAILGPLAGVALGVYLAWDRGQGRDNTERLLTYMREGDALRHVVMDFVASAQHRHPPTPSEWHAVVDAMLHKGTPDSIRRAHHVQCGTALPNEVTKVNQPDT